MKNPNTFGIRVAGAAVAGLGALIAVHTIDKRNNYTTDQRYKDAQEIHKKENARARDADEQFYEDHHYDSREVQVGYSTGGSAEVLTHGAKQSRDGNGYIAAARDTVATQSAQPEQLVFEEQAA